MKFQWTWILSILLAIVIAVFSVVNVDPVNVNYVFGNAEWPLVLVILGAALLGAAVNGFIALFKAFSTKHELKDLKAELQEKEAVIKNLQLEITELKNKSPNVLEETPMEVEPIIESEDPVIDLIEDAEK